MRDIKIGDYYDLGEIENTIISKKEENGHADQYFHKEDMKFKVFDIKEDGEILLIAEKPTEQEITLEGEIGYNNAIEVLDKLAREISGVENARSLTEEDIINSRYWVDEEKKKLLFGDDRYYWLASRCVYCYSNYAYFYVRLVDSSGVYAGSSLFASNGGTSYYSYGVRPVVSIKSNI